VLVASSPDLLAREQGDVWDSGKMSSSHNTHIVYAGQPLRSRQQCYWQVQTWDADDMPSPWSDAQTWEMGLLQRDDWSAEWIGLRDEATPPPCVYLRRMFTVSGDIQRARIYVTALGVYELQLNGARVGDAILTPGWTDYRKRVLVQTYDVTTQLRAGENVIGAILGDGWYAGALSWELQRNNYGEPPARLLLQCELTYADGTTQRIVSDGTWQATTGPIRYSGLYEGEYYDARLEQDLTGFGNLSGLRPAEVFPDHGAARNADTLPPIRVTQELKPIALTQPQAGVYVFDFGQNMVGVCRLRARGPAGTTIRLRHAEILAPDGNIYIENLRKAQATDTYVMRGDAQGETFTPRFTYHGFRYVEVTDYPDAPTLDTLTGLVFHNDAPITATFETSSAMLNQLHRNIVWGQRGNMHSVLTDCPQRDERFGWLGDAHIFARTASFNLDMAAFLTKFVRDVADTQMSNGAYTDIAPVFESAFAVKAHTPAWMDAGIIVPWILYQVYGDVRVLERHYDSMTRYVDYIVAHNPEGVWRRERGHDFGDWVPANSDTNRTMFATLFYFYSAKLLSDIARLLGHTDDAKKYRRIALRVRGAFNQLCWNGERYDHATQTINALALGFDIVPSRQRAAVARELVRDIEQRGWHLSTGFHGTPWLLPVLSELGYDAVAQKLLLNHDYPSWGYMLDKGATTIWERWNGDTGDPAMNSYNHFALGTVGEWLFRYLAGIDIASAPAGVGYQRLVIAPRPMPYHAELTWVKATYETLHGLVVSEWRNAPDRFELRVQIPANTRATIRLPTTSMKRVTVNGQPLKQAEGVRDARKKGGAVQCEIGAGDYVLVETHTSHAPDPKGFQNP
jgi:alpha-L-rhamnosidase